MTIVNMHMVLHNLQKVFKYNISLDPINLRLTSLSISNVKDLPPKSGELVGLLPAAESWPCAALPNCALSDFTLGA